MDTVVVFTAKDIDKTIEQGGCGNWKLNADRVKKCDYVILTANSHHRRTPGPRPRCRNGGWSSPIGSGNSPPAQ